MGLKNASFRLPKVLAVGQTSGSGGWVKKFLIEEDIAVRRTANGLGESFFVFF